MSPQYASVWQCSSSLQWFHVDHVRFRWTGRTVKRELIPSIRVRAGFHSTTADLPVRLEALRRADHLLVPGVGAQAFVGAVPVDVVHRQRRRRAGRHGCAANGLLAGIASVSKVVVHEFVLLVFKTFWAVGSMKGLPIHCHSESFTSPVALDDANRDSEPCILTRLATRNFRRHARAPRRGIVPTQRASSTRCNIADRVVVDFRDTTTLIRVAFLTPCIIVELKSSLHGGGFALVFADNIVVAGIATDCVDTQFHMRKLPTNWPGNA